MTKPIEAFTDYKLKTIDSYIEWEKNKLAEGRAVIIARTCLESLLKAIVVWEFRNITYSYSSGGQKVTRHVTDFNKYTLTNLKEALSNNSVHKFKYSYLLQEKEFNFTLCFKIVNLKASPN